NPVLKHAIDLRSSDIHLEPFEDEMRIRYRIDGVLQEIPVPSQIKRFQPAIVSRVKILSHLNIAEKRLPQDGRIKIRVENSEVDIRVSVIPMLHGEAVVLRLLRQNATLRGMGELGLDDRDLKSFRRILGLPHGIILVTGPTGSGKTSTLYTALNEINDAVRKIITIEDPIEYQLRGINQIQVLEKAGLTFARGLRAILRHDPDVVLIGEIRDQETAQIAVQASLTGHMVFSTLHTNDAPGALTRLVDMGVEPYLVASSLEAVLAQRLVRVLCAHCKRVDESPAARAFKVQVGIPADTTIYRSVGCRECRQTGFFGRHAIFEWMDSDDDGRQEAFRQIEGLGLTPISLAAGTNGKIAKNVESKKEIVASPWTSKKISGRTLENFTRLLSSLLAAGVPLSRALVILHREAAAPAASAKWREIHDFVVDGMSLADAMGKSPETFPRVYTAMVQAGETGGFLDLVLAQIADFQSREKELKSKVMTAMLYPSILLVLAVAVLIFLLTFF